jgi:Ca-activated chloride channel family protein
VGTAQGGPVPLSDGGFLHDAKGDMVLAGRDDAALAALARAGGGHYVAMSADPHDIDALHAELRKVPTATATGQLGDQWQDRGPWLLLPLLLIVATVFRRGWLLLLLLACLPLLPTRAEAGAWKNLWQRPDQQAAQALREGRPQEAQRLARDPAWRGVAAYRAGDYAAAAAELQHAHGGDAAYNRGNALAKAQRDEEAIKAYDEALKLDPANADAKANRKAVEDWLQQQKKQQQQQQQQKSGQKKQSGQGDGKQQSTQGDQGKDGKPDSTRQKSAQDGGKPSDRQNQSRQSQSPNESGQNHSGDQPKPQSAQERAEQAAKAEQARQALKQQMDQALAAQPAKPTGKAPSHQLGALGKDDPQSKLPADLRHALQRVQDDPGALLRRKFELEYQERHGGAPDEDGQP